MPAESAKTTSAMNITGSIWILSLTLLLAACGFQLRGVEHSINSRYESIRLTTNGKDEQFHATLRKSLKNAGVTLSENADARLEILGTKTEKRTASYSSRAKSAEFELLKTVSFRFRDNGRELISDMPLQARRSYLYRETAAVGKAEEENLLWQEMDLDLSQRILMALQRTVADGSKMPVAEYPAEADSPDTAAPATNPAENVPVDATAPDAPAQESAQPSTQQPPATSPQEAAP